MTTLYRTNSENPDFKSLVKLLDRELSSMYGEFQATYDAFNAIQSIDTVVVAQVEGKSVGCGCFKRYDEKSVEIKRMFVVPEFRGQGISKRVLGELERWAREMGFARAILETGDKQSAAIELYRRSGYKKTPNYGQYESIESSVCFAKELGVPALSPSGVRQRNMVRSIAAIATAFFANVIISLLTDQLFHYLGVYPPWGKPMFNPAQNALALSYRLIYTVGSGYLAARLAPRNRIRHAIILGIIGLVPSIGGTIVTVSNGNVGPVWFPLALVVTAVPCSWLGGLMTIRSSRP